MCSHYQAVKDADRLQQYFGVNLPVPGDLAIKTDMWPSYLGSFIRAHPYADVGDEAVPLVKCLPGRFGLVPHWADSTKLTKSTFNARSETAAEKPSFRDAWKKSQHCIIPSLGDGFIVMLIFGVGWAVRGQSDWTDQLGWAAKALMLITGLSVAVIVEWVRFYGLNRWNYTASMPLLPGLGIGVVPVLQMLILPSLIFRMTGLWLARMRWA